MDPVTGTDRVDVLLVELQQRLSHAFEQPHDEDLDPAHQLAAIDAALATLRAVRDVYLLDLVDIDRIPVGAIATELGISKQAVHQQLTGARRRERHRRGGGGS